MVFCCSKIKHNSSNTLETNNIYFIMSFCQSDLTSSVLLEFAQSGRCAPGGYKNCSEGGNTCSWLVSREPGRFLLILDVLWPHWWLGIHCSTMPVNNLICLPPVLYIQNIDNSLEEGLIVIVNVFHKSIFVSFGGFLSAVWTTITFGCLLSFLRIPQNQMEL